MEWLLKNTYTGKKYKEDSTVLCWIHSHVEGKPSYLSSKDLHFHHILQETFPHIQALIVNISGNIWNCHEFYNFSQHGKERVRKCMKKPHLFHASCSQSDFYQTVTPTFDDLPLVVNNTSGVSDFFQTSCESNVDYENVRIPNYDGEDDTSSASELSLFDPSPEFQGRELLNREGYICYLNAISNGLLSLKSFRQLIPFMNPMMRDFFNKILSGDVRNLERLRRELHNFNPNFPHGIHSDACEALDQIIKLIDLNALFQISLVEIKRKQKCATCAEENMFSVDAYYGSPNILMLKQSDKNNIQDEVNSYIK